MRLSPGPDVAVIALAPAQAAPIIEAMEAIGLQINAVNAIGGGSTSPVWTQIISDVTGRSLRVVEHPLEAGAIGLAVGRNVWQAEEPLEIAGKIAKIIWGQRS